MVWHSNIHLLLPKSQYLIRPPGRLVPKAICFSRDVFFFFLTRHRISELRRPIAAKLCTVISICGNFLMQVQKLGGRPLKIFTPLEFRSILHNFRLSSRISLEQDKISKIGKTCDLERFLPRSGKQARWTLVHYPQSSTCEYGPTQVDFFDGLYFGPYGVLALEIFACARVWPSLVSAHRIRGRGSRQKF